MVEALGRRGVPARTATFAARAGPAVFTTAVPAWPATPAAGFPGPIQQAPAELRAAAA